MEDPNTQQQFQANVSHLPPLPLPTVSTLVNNFLLSSTRFLNGFVNSADEKLTAINGKIAKLECLLDGLDAKLGSVPDESESGGPMSDQVPADIPTANGGGTNTETNGPPTPPPGTTTTPSTVSQGSYVTTTTEVTELTTFGPPPGQRKAKDHPLYRPFFKQLKFGVPLQQVLLKAGLAGVSVGVLEGSAEDYIDFDGEDTDEGE